EPCSHAPLSLSLCTWGANSDGWAFSHKWPSHATPRSAARERLGWEPDAVRLEERRAARRKTRRPGGSSENYLQRAALEARNLSRGRHATRKAERGAQAGCELVRGDFSVAVRVERVEHRVGAAPLFARDEAITVEVPRAEQFARRVGAS